MIGVELEVVKAGIEYVASRYALDPVMSRVDARLRRFVPLLHNKLGSKTYRASDRVLVRALEEAAVTDDELVASYIGGVAGSGPDDDAGTAVIAQISRLSSLQLRLHYLIYRAVWQAALAALAASNGSLDLRDPDQLQTACLMFIPMNEIYAVLGLPDEPRSVEQVTSLLRVLAREDLIARELIESNGRLVPGYLFGSEAQVPQKYSLRYSTLKRPGLMFAPTPAGIELFLWGCGADEHDPVAMRMLPNSLAEQPNVSGCPGAEVLHR